MSGDDGEGGAGGRKAVPASAYSRAVHVLDGLGPRPQLVVLALNHTVWPFEVQACEKEDGDVVPRANPYADVDGILAALRSKGVKVAGVIPQGSEHTARALLEHFKWTSHFDAIAEFPTEPGEEPLGTVRRKLGVGYTTTVYFDSDKLRVREVARLGATASFVPNGLTINLLEQALSKFAAADLDNRGF